MLKYGGKIMLTQTDRFSNRKKVYFSLVLPSLVGWGVKRWVDWTVKLIIKYCIQEKRDF